MSAVNPGNDQRVFTISRAFGVPIGAMFGMWTTPEHMTQWMAPAGFQMELYVSDIQPGGRTFYRMWGAGIEMFGRSEFLKVKAPNLIIYKQQFCDKDEKMFKHPLAPVWPETMLLRIEFLSEDKDHTRLTITCEPTGRVTEEERIAFIAEHQGMARGWTGSLDKLESYCSQCLGK